MLDNEAELKGILHGYNPERDDTGAPEPVAEAMRIAQEDPELRTWLHDEHAFDQAFGEKLQSIAVPYGLDSRILAATRAAQRLTAESSNHFSTLPDSRPRRQPLPSKRRALIRKISLSIAAIFMIGIAIVMLVPRNALNAMHPSVQALVDDATLFDRPSEADLFQAPAFDQLFQHLRATGAPAPFVVPSSLRRMHGIGCQTVTLQSHPAAFVCLRDTHDYLLFSISRSSIPEQNDISVPMLMQVGHHATATWTCRKMIYILVTTASMPELQAVL